MEELRSELKELLYQMMLKEMKKLEYENERKLESTFYGEKAAQTNFEYHIYEADKEEYILALRFEELRRKLLSKTETFLSDFNSFPNTTRIATTNLIERYGLEYPLCWNYKNSKIEYISQEEVDKNYDEFIGHINRLHDKRKISNFEKTRLSLAAKYFHDENNLALRLANEKNVELKLH
jgi:hypothetical protein